MALSRKKEIKKATQETLPCAPKKTGLTVMVGQGSWNGSVTFEIPDVRRLWLARNCARPCVAVFLVPPPVRR